MPSKTKQQVRPKTITLDAQDKILGRLATEIAIYLQGKHLASYAPHIDFPQEVRVNNVGGVKVTGKKEEQKTYWHHSGYPGGMSGRKYKDVFAKNPSWILRNAVKGMLPKNKLQAKRIKRLIMRP